MRTGRGRALAGKIVSNAALKRIIGRLKRQGKRVVFTNGCFDILHYGHVQYLEDARAEGDILVVALNSDRSLRRLKGPRRPLVKQLDRIRTIAALESVDYVTFFSAQTPRSLIEMLRPDVLIKGADWAKKDIAGSDVVNKYGGRVSTVRLVRGRSTTNLIKRIAKNY
jgi:rfaE bifunctional protein nucleotidyltransferase chain/domain